MGSDSSQIMIQNIQSLLTRYSFAPTERMMRRDVAQIIHVSAGILLSEDQLHIQDSVIFLRVRPAIRSELMIRQVDILTSLRSNPKTAHIVALR